MARLVECHSAKRKVTGLTPGQDTCLGCGPGPQMEARGNGSMILPHIDVSLPLSIPLFPSH